MKKLKLANVSDSLVGDTFGKFLLRPSNSGVDIVELKKKLEGLETSVEFLNKLVKKARAKNCDLKAENKAFLTNNQKLAMKVSELEQYSRLKNVEIKGIPRTQGEDRVTVIQTIGNKIDCPLTATDLDVVHRVHSKTEHKNILARFALEQRKLNLWQTQGKQEFS